MKIKNFLLKIADFKSWQLIVIALIIKFSFFLLFASLINPEQFSNGYFYSIQGDSKDYVDPVENLILNGSYVTKNGEYALRTPGLAPIILILRLFFNLENALNLILILQTLFSAISCFYLAKISEFLFKNKLIFISTFIIYTLSTYVSIWDNYLLTESFATSFLILSLYFIYSALQNKKSIQFLISGILFAWAIFLRPYLAPFALFIPILLFVSQRASLKNIILFSLTFVLAESAWIIRNYQFEERFIPLQSRVIYNDEGGLNEDLSVKWYIGAFVASFGGDHTAWNPKGASNWFFNENNTENRFPSIIFTEKLTYSRLQKIKEKCILYSNKITSTQEKKILEIEIENEISSYYNNYVKNHKFHFYVTSRLIHFVKFNFHSGVYNIPFPAFENQSLIQKAFKAIYALLYLTIITLGMIGLLIGLYSWMKKPSKLIFILIPGFILILSPFVFKMHEFRFNTLAYPFLVVMTLFVLQKLNNRFKLLR